MGRVQHERILKRCGHRPGDPAGKARVCIMLKVNPTGYGVAFEVINIENTLCLFFLRPTR